MNKEMKVRTSRRVRKLPAHLRDDDQNVEPIKKILHTDVVDASRKQKKSKNDVGNTGDEMVVSIRNGIEEENSRVAEDGHITKVNEIRDRVILRETVVQQLPDNNIFSQQAIPANRRRVNMEDPDRSYRSEIDKLKDTLRETKQLLCRTNKENYNLKTQIEEVRQLNKCLQKELSHHKQNESKDRVMDELKSIINTECDETKGIFYRRISKKRLEMLPHIIERFQAEGFAGSVSKVCALIYIFAGKIAEYICVESIPRAIDTAGEDATVNSRTTNEGHSKNYGFHWNPSMIEGDFGDLQRHNFDDFQSLEIVVSNKIDTNNRSVLFVGNCLMKRSMNQWMFSTEYPSHIAVVARQGYAAYKDIFKERPLPELGRI